MQKMATDLTTRSETQINCLQSIVLASGLPALTFMLELIVVLDVNFELSWFKKIHSWPPTSFHISTLLWNIKGSLKASLKIVALFKNPYVYATEDVGNPVLISLENMSLEDLSLYRSTGPFVNQNMGSWLSSPGQGHQLKGGRGWTPTLIPQANHLGTEFPASTGMDTFS